MIESISRVIPEITVNNNRPVTTSIAVANYFGKEHKNVLQKIRSLECSPSFTTANFSAIVVNTVAGFNERETEAYEMTRNGFVFLVMGFTGKKAAAFKEAYIAEFDRMEAELQKPVASHASGDFAIITYFENNLPSSCRPLMPDETVMTFESFMEQVIRCGYVMLPCDEIGKMTLEEMQELVDKARKVRAHWDERSASLKKKYSW